MSILSSVGAVQQELAVRLNEVSADEADVYLTWINLTTQDIGNTLTNPRYLEASARITVSSGTRNYALSGNFQSMYDVSIPQYNTKVTYVPKEQFDALSPSATNGGIPTIYTIFQEGIEFYPQPNASFDIYYRFTKSLPNLSASTSDLPIPTDFTELYVNKGVAYGLERRGDYANAQIFHKRYKDLLDKMNDNLKSIESKRMKNIREFRGGHTNDPIANAIWS